MAPRELNDSPGDMRGERKGREVMREVFLPPSPSLASQVSLQPGSLLLSDHLQADDGQFPGYRHEDIGVVDWPS